MLRSRLSLGTPHSPVAEFQVTQKAGLMASPRQQSEMKTWKVGSSKTAKGTPRCPQLQKLLKDEKTNWQDKKVQLSSWSPRGESQHICSRAHFQVCISIYVTLRDDRECSGSNSFNFFFYLTAWLLQLGRRAAAAGGAKKELLWKDCQRSKQ